MRRTLLSLAIGTSLIGIPLLAGCERELEHSKSVETKEDGTTVTKEKKVTQDTQTGEVTKTQEKKVDKPGD